MKGTLDVGSTIEGRYELVRELGAGGFARVFEARQTHLDRMVAIKVLNVALQMQDDGDTFERRFIHEAKLAGQIGHRNTVTIFEFGFAGELRQPFIAMELLDGRDLEHELKRGPMEASRAIALALPCLDAIAAGHDIGIVHKDLKPGNLFLSAPHTPQESLIVLDYGIARWDVENAEKFTATGMFTGTAEYIAPEYAKDQIVTPAIDVYQMGLIICEMLTGDLVAKADTPMGALMKHVAGKIEIPSVVRDSPLGPIIERATAHDHETRYSNAAELRDALRAIDPATADEHFAATGIAPSPTQSTEFGPEDAVADTLDAGGVVFAESTAPTNPPTNVAESADNTPNSSGGSAGGFESDPTEKLAHPARTPERPPSPRPEQEATKLPMPDFAGARAGATRGPTAGKPAAPEPSEPSPWLKVVIFGTGVVGTLVITFVVLSTLFGGAPPANSPGEVAPGLSQPGTAERSAKSSDRRVQADESTAAAPQRERAAPDGESELPERGDRRTSRDEPAKHPTDERPSPEADPRRGRTEPSPKPDPPGERHDEEPSFEMAQ